MEQLRHRLDITDLKYLQDFISNRHGIKDARLSEDLAKEIISSNQNGYDISRVNSLSELDLSKVSTQGNRIRILIAENGAYIVVTDSEKNESLLKKREMAEEHVRNMIKLESYLNSPEAKKEASKFVKKTENSEQIKEGLLLRDAQLIASNKELRSEEALRKWSEMPSSQRHLHLPDLSQTYYGKELKKLLKETRRKQTPILSEAILRLPLYGIFF